MRQMARYGLYRLLGVCVVFLLATATGWSQYITWLVREWSYPLIRESRATGVSADGSVVVGWYYTGYWYPFRWTASGGMQELSSYGYGGGANGVSADGSVVVGWVWEDAKRYPRAVRWTAVGAMRYLDTRPGGYWSEALGVSANGSVVVGWAQNAAGYGRAFRWTAAGGMKYLGTLGGDWSVAYGVSADGSVVVGEAENAALDTRAFRWTGSGGMQDLGTLGGAWSAAYGVSADGSVVVGAAYNAAGQLRAFRWTSSGGMQDLGTLGGHESAAYGVSADGSVVVGWAENAAGQLHAFVWTAAGGMKDLDTFYLPDYFRYDGWYLAAYAISADGRYIVGNGYNASSGRIVGFSLKTMAVIRGTLTLGDYGGDPSLVPVSVRLRKEGGSEETRTIYTDRNGNYSLWLEPGTYEVSFKASHWLRVNLKGVTLGPADEVTGQDATLTNGDIDGDNEVTLFDFGALVAAFGSISGDSNWNPDADLDGDAEVTLFDFGILVQNFGAIGDE
jgi:probable HAF family extracellular repeat protein